MTHTALLSIKTGSLSLAGAVLTLLAPGAARAAAKQTPYNQTVTCYNATTNQCQAVFPVVPANMRLVVEFVASSVDTPTALSIAELSGGGAFIPVLHTMQGNDSEGNKIYVANQPFTYYFTAGQQPSMFMNAQAASFEFMSGSVTLVGYLVAAAADQPE